MSDTDEVKYKYASGKRIYYPEGDDSLRDGAYYVTNTLSAKQRKVFYEYANNHSSGAPFRGRDGRDFVLKREGGDFIILE